MNTLVHRRLWRSIGWGLVALVVVLSLIPAPQLPDVGVSDKFEHLLAYAVLMAWFGQTHGARLLPFLGLVFMGAALEVLQGMTGYREMSAYDQIANMLGVCLGWLSARRYPDVLARIEARLP